MTITALNPTKLAEIQERAEAAPADLVILDNAPSLVSMRDAVAAMDGTKVSIAPKLYAVIGGPTNGLWTYASKYVPGKEGQEGYYVEEPVQITDWVIWREAEHASAITTDSFRVKKVEGTILYDLALIRADGRVYRTNAPLDAETSVHPLKVLTAINAGVVSVTASHKAAVESALLVLGHEDQERRIAYRRGGWLDDNGIPVFIEPAGAITPAGLSTAYPMEDVEGANVHSGAASTDVDAAEVEDMLRRFRAIAPNRVDILVGLLGALGAAPLGIKSRTGLHLVGGSDLGKSTLVMALQRMFTLPERGEKFNMDFDSTSAVGISNTISQLPLATLDDIRFNDGTASTEFDKLQKYAQGMYQQKNDAKAQQTGRNRGTNYGATQAVVISTSETLPRATGSVALINRLVVTRLNAGDVDFGVAIPFINDLDLPGSAMWGAYVRSLAGEAQRDGLVKWVANNNADRAEVVNRWDAKRTKHTVSLLAYGWDRLAAWLRSIGVDIDDIITPAEAEEAFAKLVVEAGEFAAESNPMVSIMRHLREQILGGTGHLAGPDGTVPANAGQWGWTNNSNAWHGNGPRIGEVCEEKGTILITRAAIQAAKAHLKFSALEVDQIEQGLDVYPGIMNDLTSKSRYDKTPERFGFQRKPGAVLPISWAR